MINIYMLYLQLQLTHNP